MTTDVGHFCKWGSYCLISTGFQFGTMTTFFFNMDGEEGMCLVPLYGTLNLKIIQMVNLTLFYYNKALLNKF